MLQKDLFVKFIERSYLNKTIDKFVLEAKNKTLSTFHSMDGFGYLTQINDFDLEDCELGIYYPEQLLKMTSILDSEFTIDIKTVNEVDIEKAISIKFKDKKGTTATYALMDIDLFVIPEKRNIKSYDFVIKANLNLEVIDNILKANNIIGGDEVTFTFEKNKLYITFGELTNNKNQIKFEIVCEKLENVMKNQFAFNSKRLQSILSVNSKKFQSGCLEIVFLNKDDGSGAGTIMKITFEEENSKAQYLLAENEE